MKRHLETRRGYSENQLAPSRLIAKISLKCARLIAESNRASGNSRGRQACLVAVEHRHYVTDIHATVLHQLGLDPRKLEMPGSVTLNSTNKMNSSRVCVLASKTARRGSRETDRPGCFESLAGFVERQSCVWLAKKCQDDAIVWFCRRGSEIHCEDVGSEAVSDAGSGACSASGGATCSNVGLDPVWDERCSTSPCTWPSSNRIVL